jgi:hypothetical protein
MWCPPSTVGGIKSVLHQPLFHFVPFPFISFSIIDRIFISCKRKLFGITKKNSGKLFQMGITKFRGWLKVQTCRIKKINK